MFNVRCSSAGKDKGAVQTPNIGWQTLCCSRQTWDLLPPATKEPQSWKIWAASKNQDQDLEFICCIFHIIVVNTTFSGWMYICFTVQHTCKCISFSCGTQSLFFNLLPWSHLRYSDRLQTPNPGTRWGCKLVRHPPPQGSLSFLILRYPNLEKTPNLNRFYKKEKTGSTW